MIWKKMKKMLMKKRSIERPYPRYCVCCKNQSVNKETISHNVRFLYNGSLHQININNLVVDICSSCKQQYFTIETDEQMSTVIEGYKNENVEGKF